MSRKLDDLVPEFKIKVDELLHLCEHDGYVMKPFFTLRTPFEQAKLWRQSRSTQQIKRKINFLNENGAEFLAFCIEFVGPQNGRHVTNAIPGLSWHQFGEAVDCYWLLKGEAEWSVIKIIQNLKGNWNNGYHKYAIKAKSIGLTAGGFWTGFRDWPHVQLRAESNPMKIYSLQEIDQRMKNKFYLF